MPKPGLRDEDIQKSILGGTSRALVTEWWGCVLAALGSARIVRGNEEVKRRGQAWYPRVPVGWSAVCKAAKHTGHLSSCCDKDT